MYQEKDENIENWGLNSIVGRRNSTTRRKVTRPLSEISRSLAESEQYRRKTRAGSKRTRDGNTEYGKKRKNEERKLFCSLLPYDKYAKRCEIPPKQTKRKDCWNDATAWEQYIGPVLDIHKCDKEKSPEKIVIPVLTDFDWSLVNTVFEEYAANIGIHADELFSKFCDPVQEFPIELDNKCSRHANLTEIPESPV